MWCFCVCFSLSSVVIWVRCGAWLYRSLICLLTYFLQYKSNFHSRLKSHITNLLLTSILVDIRVNLPKKVIFSPALLPRWISLFQVDKSSCWTFIIFARSQWSQNTGAQFIGVLLSYDTKLTLKTWLWCKGLKILTWLFQVNWLQ